MHFHVMNFWLQPSVLAPLQAQNGPKAKTGVLSIDFRVPFGKEVLLRMALGDIFMLRIFGTLTFGFRHKKVSPVYILSLIY